MATEMWSSRATAVMPCNWVTRVGHAGGDGVVMGLLGGSLQWTMLRSNALCVWVLEDGQEGCRMERLGRGRGGQGQ